MKKIIITAITLCFGIIGQAQINSDLEKINEVLSKYKTSINKADLELDRSIFLDSEEITFIHPRGHQKGWESIQEGIYNMFGGRFSNRNLQSYDEQIILYDNIAVVEFYWIFDATFSDGSNDTMQTKGRETQVMKKINDQWKIAHVHYSGMPQSGERQGF